VLAPCVTYIYEEADFPVQDATTITLEAETSYCICALITTGKSFIVGQSAFICSVTQTVEMLAYTGSGVMFTSSTTWSMENLGFSCAVGTVFSHSGAGGFLIMRNSTCYESFNVGNINGSTAFLQGSSFISITNSGFTFTGANNGWLFDTGNMVTPSALTIVDFGVATFSLMRTLNSTFAGPVGAVAFSGLTGSGNINSGNKGVFEVNDLHVGGITSMAGMQPSDIRMDVRASDGLKDSKNVSDSFLIGGPETITVAVSGDFYEIGIPSVGSWDSDINERFTLNADGSHTYDGETDIDVIVAATAAIEKVGGGSDQLEVRIAKNWTAGSTGELKTRSVTQNTTITSLTSVGVIPVTNGDNIRVIFANNTSTSNILAEVTSLTISGQ
jgi:hypothetical protein